jgi:hypothetical protein
MAGTVLVLTAELSCAVLIAWLAAAAACCHASWGILWAAEFLVWA